MADLLQVMVVHAEPSLIRTLLGACGLGSLRDEVQTLPGGCLQTPVGAHTPGWMRTLPGWADGRVEGVLELLQQGNSPTWARGSFFLGNPPA